jgi:hypothetical protein
MVKTNKRYDAIRKYMELANTLGYKPDNLRYLSTDKINAAYEKLNKINVPATVKSHQKLNSTVYPKKSEMWAYLKANNFFFKKNLQYNKVTSKQLYKLTKRGDENKFSLSEKKSNRIKNPINNTYLNKKSLNKLLNVGYQLNNNVLSLPAASKELKKVKATDGTFKYIVPKKFLKNYKSGVIFFTSSDHKNVLMHTFRVDEAISPEHEALHLEYQYPGFTIIKIELYKHIPLNTDFGVAYRSFDNKNCVISALESSLKKDLTKFHKEYKYGVTQSDYEVIAKKLDIGIRVHISHDLKFDYNMARCQKIHNLLYLNNHVICYKNVEKQIIKYDNIDDNLETIFNNESIDAITNVIKVNDEIVSIETTDNIYRQNYQTINKEKIAIKGDGLTATSEYKKAFLNVNQITPIDKHLDDAKQFCRHGIKILKSPYELGSTIDLKRAYNNFMHFPSYDGMPFDISFFVKHNDDELDNILTYAGFGLVEWINVFTNKMETRWASIPHIKSRLANSELLESNGLNSEIKFYKWALAFRKGDYDLSMFDGTGKRLWQYVVGSLSKTTFSTSMASTDPILAQNEKLFQSITISDKRVYFGQKDDPSVKPLYTHVTAYVQSYTEIELESKYFDVINKFGIDSIYGIYVDGISTTIDKKALSILEDPIWSVKSNSVFHFDTESDDVSYIKANIGNIYDGEFVNIHVTGDSCIKVIDGPAGSGKSTLLKKIAKMSDSVILVQNNTQKSIYDEFNVMTVDMYLTKNQFNVKDSFVLIDEYFQMDPKKLMYFRNALLVGNKEQLSIYENPIDYQNYDHHLLTKIYRYNDDLNTYINDRLASNKYDYSKFVEVEDALKNGKLILAATHQIINKINNIALKLKLAPKLRFTKTNLKSDIFANDDAEIRNGRVFNLRNSRYYSYTLKDVGVYSGCKCKHDCKCKMPILCYSFAKTYHSTQGKEYDDIVLCVDSSTKKMLYTGMTRIHAIDELKFCSVYE